MIVRSLSKGRYVLYFKLIYLQTCMYSFSEAFHFNLQRSEVIWGSSYIFLSAMMCVLDFYNLSALDDYRSMFFIRRIIYKC